ncbi:MAG: bstEII [Ktedonobacteraceae bacterium]
MTNPPSKTFADYKAEKYIWITTAKGQYYPEYLPDANLFYQPVQELFGQLVKSSASAEHLFWAIDGIGDKTMRVQLWRVFHKYVSPETSVEMLKVKKRAKDIIKHFAAKFRPIQEVQKAFMSRPLPDETLSALLWEHKDRGRKGYDLTEQFFELFSLRFPDLDLKGPKRAGADIPLGKVFQGYPEPKYPVDFVIYDNAANLTEEAVLVVGLARYDSDRGGSQEDDRIRGYRNCANEILSFAQTNKLKVKVIFLNEGPGLLLGSMWDDYASLERSWPGKIMVLTLRMIPERLTLDWLRS